MSSLPTETDDSSESAAAEQVVVPDPEPATDTVDLDVEPVAATVDLGAIEELLAQSRAKLDELSASLAAVDAELETLAGERRQRDLLQGLCRDLDELQQLGGAGMFWQGLEASGGRDEHMARVRGHIDAFQQRLAGIESRREEIVEEISARHQEHFLLEDEAFEAQEEEEKRLNEWIVEREVEAIRSRPNSLPWTSGGDDDRRFRKSVSIALLACLLFMLVVPFIDLPIHLLEPEQELPERVVTVIPEVKKLREAPPPPELKPREKKVVEQKPEPVPQPTPEAPQQQAPAPPQGLLAFREDLAQVQEVASISRLGKSAQINDDVAARSERSMLTSNNPGSSGGIQLSSVSRGFGESGGSTRGAIQGTALTQASSSISSVGPGARPLSNGPGLARTDEEIQIVFDRHKAALYRLYNRELRRDPTLQGKIVLRLTIEPDGSVSMCQVASSEIDAPELAAQVAERVRGFDFGAKEVPAITIVYPIDFLPAG